MALIALVTIGILGDGFLLYALFRWMRDDGARNRHRKVRNSFKSGFHWPELFSNRTGICREHEERTPNRVATPGYIQDARRNVRLESRGGNVRDCQVKGTTVDDRRARRVHDLQPNHGKENDHPAGCNVAKPDSKAMCAENC